MGIKCYKPLICLFLAFSFLVLGACSDSLKNKDYEVSAQQTNENALSNNLTETTKKQQYLVSKLNERTEWNIDISFLEVGKSGFKIRICDNDNQGFYYNPIYFILEYKEKNGWEKLTNLQESLANEDIAVVFPDENKDYTDTNNINMFSLVPGFELKNGQYRITKVISGKEFSVEFEIKKDVPDTDESSYTTIQHTKKNAENSLAETNTTQSYPKSKLSERTSWNIDISFLEVGKSGFKIRICDNDNQGFYYNPIYFVLEYKGENGWEKLNNLQENLADKDLVFVYPDENKDYVDTNNVVMFSLVPDFELKNGQYRITKVISGKEFSTEFEITGQPS